MLSTIIFARIVVSNRGRGGGGIRLQDLDFAESISSARVLMYEVFGGKQILVKNNVCIGVCHLHFRVL